MREPRKLLFVLSEVFANGGIQRFNRTLLAASEGLGFPFDAYSLNDTNRTSSLPNVPVTGFNQSKPRFAQAVFRAIRGGDYAAVVIGHVNFVELTALALRCRTSRRPTSLLVTHGVDVWTGIQGMRRISLRNINEILCVSHYTKSMIRRQAPELPEERFAVFPNALHATWSALELSDHHPAALLERRYEQPERFLLSVARLSPYDRAKGIISVIEALRMIDDTGIHYVIAGDGEDRAFLQLIAARLEVSDRVHFLGAVTDDELFSLYRRCEAFVLPSGQEGFGIVFLEAMYFGAPVIAADEKGAVDVVQHEHSGVLVNFGDIVALKAAIDRVLADDALRARLRAGGTANVTDGGPFTFAAFSQRWSSLMHQRLDG